MMQTPEPQQRLSVLNLDFLPRLFLGLVLGLFLSLPIGLLLEDIKAPKLT
jgi:hypothetical protein